MKIRIDPLDVLFSRFIRLRAKGQCERCLQEVDFKRLQTAHFDGRARKSVRWDEDNACACCCGCHRYLDAHPIEKIEFFKKLLGEEGFEALQGRMRQIGMPDKKMIEIYLKEKIKELE